MTYTVAVFEVDRAYGGPEEGGWWFTYGLPLPKRVQLPHAASWTRFRSRQAAIGFARRLNAKLARDNDDLSSVTCEHHLVAYVCGGKPQAFPAVRPRYE
jgi:hypothetical protein